ncbi:helix-turn-helix domain-containing protein [Pseudodonghicola flavimaris]|uniref:Helix-turn-helix domain-containing protein n=1 Tax=Pseudodonghicola flavimaris TaxID=3050036 RepID=A0ABT7EZ44_9RHOB|nr:helix-turn-helix domain-containing protein [Pseudodonghicola flavimaris]MDK3017607.1 helix-turn-helix domain-containing protein [Pseudodonghicola flavimaris]
MVDESERFLEGLRRVMDARGLKDTPLSLAAGLHQSFIRDLKRGKAASPKLSSAVRIANALNMTVEDIMNWADGPMKGLPTVAIAGTVGAGARVPLFDAYEKGDGPQVECPPGLSPHGIVAVEIEGDSMEPIYSAGDLLFYTRETHEGVPDDVVGHRCVCEDDEGMGWVKQIKPGDEPGLFHLISLNPGATTMWNKRLKWAARVRLHWPNELAQKSF